MAFIKVLFYVILAFGMLWGVIELTAENPMTFINLPGLLLVLGGTFIATILSYPRNALLLAFSSLYHAMQQPSHDFQKRLHQYAETMQELRKGQLKEAEEKTKKIHNACLKTAAQMMIDGASSADILKVLDWHLEKARSSTQTNAAVFWTMASFAPAFGMMGTLIGLVNMLDTMEGGDFTYIGSNMAVALITTFYGLLLANILFKPLAVKVEQKMHEDTVLLAVAKEAVTYLSEGKPPAYTNEILKKYLEGDAGNPNV